MKIKVRVNPRAKIPRIIQDRGILKIYLTEPAIEGKANKRLVEALAEYFGVKKYNIKILKGHKQKDKIVEIGEAS